MVTVHDAQTDELLQRAGAGDAQALEELLDRHRGRLLQMVAVRMDRRLASRIDASDVVQEALAEGARRLLEYLDHRPGPFFLWLRTLAWQRLVDLSRRHLYAQRRGVVREVGWGPPLPEESAAQLVDRLVSSRTSPSGQAQRRELRDRVRAALGRLKPSEREVLVLRHLEQLSTREVAAVMGVAERTVRHRQRRALESLGTLLGEGRESEGPP